MKIKKNGEARNIGVDVKPPTEKCENDRYCPFHGKLPLRGRTFKGTVLKSRMLKYATVEWSRPRLIKKYDRYEFRRSRVAAHNPLCIKAGPGDSVVIMECRKLSKTKSFVIIEKLATKAGGKGGPEDRT